MKKFAAIFMCAALAVGALSGCSSNENSSTADNSTAGNPISVVTREDGSGTRGAFVELFGIEDADGNDAITQSAEISNSTSVVMTTVAGNPDAIGYISLGSLNLYSRCVETLLPSPKEQAKIRKQVKKALDSAPLPDFPCPVICGVGGTIRGAGKLCNYLYKLPAGNRTITLNMVDGLLERFSAPAKADLQILLKIVPERVHTLLPGLVILSTLAHRCRGDAIEVSSYGVREGFLLTEVLKRRSVTV